MYLSTVNEFFFCMMEFSIYWHIMKNALLENLKNVSQRVKELEKKLQ